jgi:hypothetical protein
MMGYTMPQKADRKGPVGPKLEYDVCSRCGSLFDDQGENGWWFEGDAWWHECNVDRPAKIVVRRLPRVA